MRIKKHPELDIYITDCGKVLRECKQSDRNGYKSVSHQRKKYGVHRLVAQAFLDNPENKPCVCHKDDNPHNNHVDNLWWGTFKENMLDMVSKGRNNPPRGVRTETVEKFNTIKELSWQGWSTAEIAKHYSTSKGTIAGIYTRMRFLGYDLPSTKERNNLKKLRKVSDKIYVTREGNMAISTYKTATIIKLGMELEALILFYTNGSNEVLTFASKAGLMTAMKQRGLV